MQKVVVELDWFTRTVLVLIAVLLAGILAKPLLVGNPVSGYGQQRVIVDNTYPIPVKVTNEVSTWTTIAGSVAGSSIDVYITGQKKSLEVGKVDAYIYDISDKVAFVVVDWKEKKEYDREKLTRLFKQWGMSEEEIEVWFQRYGLNE